LCLGSLLIYKYFLVTAFLPTRGAALEDILTSILRGGARGPDSFAAAAVVAARVAERHGMLTAIAHVCGLFRQPGGPPVDLAPVYDDPSLFSCLGIKERCEHEY